MFTILVVILIFQVLSCESRISWKEYEPKSITLPSIFFYNGKLSVPTDYESPEESPKLTLHIRKMCSSTSPIWNIIALPGGPGQISKVYVDRISIISKSLKNIPFCLYTLDHRGVGKTKPKLIEEADSKNWMSKIEELSNNPNFPLHTLPITNAAMDVLELDNPLKRSFPNFKLGLIDSSYGSMLTHRIISINSNIFDIYVLKNHSVPKNDPPNAINLKK